MDFDIPADLTAYLAELDEFIEREIRPLERQDDNIRFFDYRREDARTDWDRGGLPSRDWEALLAEARRRADAAGHYRYAFPAKYGGRDGTNLGMAVIREHLAAKGLGLHCDLQNEHMIVGNNVGLLLMIDYGTPQQQAEWVEDLAAGRRGFAFGITEPAHGSDATFMETTAVRDGGDWVINGEKTWNTGVHAASHDLIFARTSGKPGDADGITAFLTPIGSPGFTVEEYLWTFNMPTDHAHVSSADVRVPDGAIFGGEGRGLQVVQHFFNENRIRQAASSLGAAQYCVSESVAYALERKPFGKPLASQPGDPVPAGRAADAVRDAPRADPQDRLADGHRWPVLRLRQGLDVQLLGEPALLRGRRPGDAGARRPRLLTAQAVRAHLPAPPPVPDHRGCRGDPDAPRRGLPVRLHAPACPEGRGGGLMPPLLPGRPSGRERLAPSLRPSIGPVSVEGLTRLSGGASKETWAFDAVAADGTRTGLILRRDPPGRPGEPGALDREAAALGLAHDAGLPVPEVLLHSAGPVLGTAGMVMRRVDGETIARKILRDDAYAQAREVLPGQLGQFAARLHALELPAALPQPDPVATLRQQLDSFGQPSQVFGLALAELERQQPPAREPVIVHGDFRLGNLIAGPEGLRAVLDWELTHAGSPAEDLGWLCVKAWRFGVEPPVAGMGSREELLAAYRAARAGPTSAWRSCAGGRFSARCAGA